MTAKPQAADWAFEIESPAAESFTRPTLVGPGMYVLVGGTGIGVLPVVETNGGAAISLDGAWDGHISAQAASRVRSVGLPQRQYRTYHPTVVQNPKIFHPELQEMLRRLLGGDDQGGAQFRALGRLATVFPQTQTRLVETAEAIVAMLKNMRSGRLDGCPVHYVSSTCGGMGSAILLDVRKHVNDAMLSNSVGNVNNVMWMLGTQAFDVFDGRRARRLNHIATTMELAAEVIDLQPEEAHAYDLVVMIDLPHTPDEVRLHGMRQVLRFSNPTVWDRLFGILTNSLNRHVIDSVNGAEVPWLASFLHFSGGPLGTSVLIDEVIAEAASRVSESITVTTEPEAVTVTILPEVKFDKGQELDNEAITTVLRQGKLAGLLQIMDVHNVTATLQTQFALRGAPVAFENFLQVPVSITSAEVARRMRVLNTLLDQLTQIHTTAVSDRDAALAQLDENGQGAMARLHQIARMQAPRVRSTAIATVWSRTVRSVKDSALQEKQTVGGDLSSLMEEIRQARITLAKATAIIELLESPDDPDKSLIKQLQMAIGRLGTAKDTARRTFELLTQQTVVSPAARLLVTDEIVRVVDDLIRRGRTLADVKAEVWKMLSEQPMSLGVLGALLGVRPEVHEVAVKLASLFTDAHNTARYWTTPVLPPWLRVILTPRLDEALYRALQAELTDRLPGVELWIDEVGDGDAISFAFGIVHGVRSVNEVCPEIWAEKWIPSFMDNPYDKAARTFVDRPFPKLHQSLEVSS